jgi:D-beta-D-heptose 7-phosphate kinase/D-beta-D-heptose 1-phosphate adenosyltransferase
MLSGMSYLRTPEAKILTRSVITERVAESRAAGNRVVFTNGAFDILHIGHVTYLDFARRQGDEFGCFCEALQR